MAQTGRIPSECRLTAIDMGFKKRANERRKEYEDSMAGVTISLSMGTSMEYVKAAKALQAEFARRGYDLLTMLEKESEPYKFTKLERVEIAPRSDEELQATVEQSKILFEENGMEWDESITVDSLRKQMAKQSSANEYYANNKYMVQVMHTHIGMDYPETPWKVGFKIDLTELPKGDDFPDGGKIMQTNTFGIIHLSIKRHDREPVSDWRDMQEIKNQIVGKEHEAVEIYPADSRLVDTANQYHLWVLDTPRDEGGEFPFGMFRKQRTVMTEGQSGSLGSKQRGYEEE